MAALLTTGSAPVKKRSWIRRVIVVLLVIVAIVVGLFLALWAFLTVAARPDATLKGEYEQLKVPASLTYVSKQWNPPDLDASPYFEYEYSTSGTRNQVYNALLAATAAGGYTPDELGRTDNPGPNDLYDADNTLEVYNASNKVYVRFTIEPDWQDFNVDDVQQVLNQQVNHVSANVSRFQGGGG